MSGDQTTDGLREEVIRQAIHYIVCDPRSSHDATLGRCAVAAEAVLRALAEAQPVAPELPPRTRLILASEDLLASFGTRTEDGYRITAEWGEQRPEGWYEPTFTVHQDQPVAPELDAAWREAEVALPDGWRLEVTRMTDSDRWLAVAGRRTYLWDGDNSYVGDGDTPAAALRALAARLRAEEGTRP